MNHEPISSETSRQALHMMVGGFALLLRWLSYPLALACAMSAVLFNVFVLPRLPGSKRRLYRPEELERGFSTGILMYPVSVFTLILLFPMPVAASLWGVLSFGDGMATLVGMRAGTRAGARASVRRGLPWNKAKSLEGLTAFFAAAAPAASFLYWWTIPNVSSSPPWWRSPRALELFGSLAPGAIICISLATAAVCAVLETLNLGVDDNLLAPIGGAGFMVGLIYVFHL